MPSDSELSEVLSVKTNPFTLSKTRPSKPPSSLGIQNRTRHRAQRRPVTESRPKPAQPKPPRTQNVVPEVTNSRRSLANIPTWTDETELFEPSRTPSEDDDYHNQNNPETSDQDANINGEEDQSLEIEVPTRRARPKTSVIHDQCSVIEENETRYYKCNHCK